MNGIDRISTGSIKAIKGMNKRPVYYLTMAGKNKPTITVKGENRSDDDKLAMRHLDVVMKWSGKLLKNIKDLGVKPEIMDPTEVFIFKTRVRELLKNEPDKQLSLNISGLTWVKMPYTQALTDNELFLKNKLNNWESKSKGVKQLFKKFSDEKTWVSLGRVMAIDLFDGNVAHFNSSGHWISEGNETFHKIIKGIKVGALDTFDVKNSPDTNLNNPLTPQVRGHLDLLISNVMMQEFAKTVTTEIAGFILKEMGKVPGGGIDKFVLTSGGRKITISRKGKPDFFHAYIEDMCAGMQASRDEIKRHLLDKTWQYERQWMPVSRAVTGIRVGKGNNSSPSDFIDTVRIKTIPKGIQERMKYCGWI